MPTKDYDPINELIEAIHNSGVHTWPTIKATTDTKGNIYISRGSTNDCVIGKLPDIHEPIKITANGSLSIVEEKPVDPVDPFAIRSVLSNRRKNAFSVVWEDGTTTVVHCQSGDEWDDEKALAMCFTKKALGNKGNFNDKFNDALDNKMKVIPAKATGGTIKMSDSAISFTRPIVLEDEAVKKMAETPEKTLHSPINGQLTIDDIPIREEINNILTETTRKAEQRAVQTSKNLASMIRELTESPEPKKEESYELYLIGIFTSAKRLVHCGTINELHDFIKSYATKGGLGYYFRTWNADGGMYLDYGSYNQYFFIPGITNSEYAGK